MAFDSGTATVTHKADAENPDGWCITTVALALTAGECTLTVEAGGQYDQADNLVITSITFDAKEGCEGLPDITGVWTGGGLTEHLVLGKPAVPAGEDDPVCFPTYFVIELDEPLTGADDATLPVSGTVIQISGEMISSGDAEAECPKPWVGATGDKFGCADGTREGFINMVTYPKIAAWGGAWDVPGGHNPDPAGEMTAGNDGENAAGTGCNVADLCAEGWHVCLGKDDVLSRNPLGCGGIMDGAQSPAFFLARTSSVGAFNCSQDSTLFGDPGTSNDLFGCGDLGCSTKSQKTLGSCGSKGCDPLDTCEGCEEGKCADGTLCKPGTCFPLTLGSHDLCKTLKVMPNCSCSTDAEGKTKCTPSSGGCGWCKPVNYWNQHLGLDLKTTWSCGGSTVNEANSVTKDDPATQGGVMCCVDDLGED